MCPEDRKYTPNHQWVLVMGDEAAVGLTPYALVNLEEILAVDLPQEEQNLSSGEIFGVIQSAQGFLQLPCPLDGQVVAVNEGLKDVPERINLDPYDTGWLIRIKLFKPEQVKKLLEANEYANFLQKAEKQVRSRQK